MNYRLTITLNPEGRKDFKYILSITNTSQTVLGSRITHYGSIGEIEMALIRAGWHELMEKARQQLKAGLPFTNVMNILDYQISVILNR